MIDAAYMNGYILKCTPKPSRRPAKNIFLCSIAQRRAMTITPSSPSELPLVLMVATMGFKSQMLANFSALSVDIFFSLLRTNTISHPAIISPTANKTLPNENHVLDHVVGNSIQASKGVYRYVSRSYGEYP